MLPMPAPTAETAPSALPDMLRAMRPTPGLSAPTQDCTYAMAYHWLQSGDFEKARSAFETLWRACPDRHDYAAGLANSALGQGQPDVAVAYFLLAVELDASNAGYLLGLGRAFRACKLPGHARLALGLAIAEGERQQNRQTSDTARACLQLMGDE